MSDQIFVGGLLIGGASLLMLACTLGALFLALAGPDRRY